MEKLTHRVLSLHQQIKFSVIFGIICWEKKFGDVLFINSFLTDWVVIKEPLNFKFDVLIDK